MADTSVEAGGKRWSTGGQPVKKRDQSPAPGHGLWQIVKDTAGEFTAVPTMSLSAGTAYYAAFSIGPLLVVVIGLAGLVFGEAQVRQEVGRQLQMFLGPQSAHLVESMMSAQFKGGSLTATIIGTTALVFGATGVFSQLQASLNMIWGVTARPGNSLWLFIRDRLLSMAMVLAIGFLLLLSMALSAFVSAFTHYVGQAISVPVWMAPVFENLVSLVVIASLFALMFKILPDVQIRWRDVAAGALGTALLFTAGKYVLSLYLKHEISASAYGAGSAFIVILLYVFYASVVLYLGAEFTKVYAKHQGLRLKPSEYAVPVKEETKQATS
jgi:membrane protein